MSIVLAVTGGVAATAEPAAAAAGVTCSFNAVSHVATIDADGTQGIIILRSGDDITFNGSACGTVTTVDTVNINLPLGTGAIVRPELTNGAFAPGFTDEGNGSSEIEFSINRIDSGIWLKGTTGFDGFAYGQHLDQVTFESVGELNLNAGEATPDVDMTWRGNPELKIDPDQGGSAVSGQGTGVFSSKASFATTEFTDRDGADTFTGGNGRDNFVLGGLPLGADSFAGGGGVDSLFYGFRTVGVAISQDGVANDGEFGELDNVQADIEQLGGSVGNDTIVAGAAPNEIYVGGGTNTVDGGGGDDVIAAGSGTGDQYHGGSGRDTVTFEFTFGTGATASLDGAANDGHPGQNHLVGSDVEDLCGSEANDTLIGDAGPNRLCGFRGDDELSGLGGGDVLDGGGFLVRPPDPSVPPEPDGSDELRGGLGIDTVSAGATDLPLVWSIDNRKNDHAAGSDLLGVDNIHTDVENAIGGSSDDRIVGSSSGNRLAGGGGDDTLIGLGGKDVLVPGAGDDFVSGDDGVDTVDYGDSPGPITASLPQRTASGNGPDSLQSLENIAGSPFGDRLTGSTADNTLSGLDGGDVLDGIGGNDTLLGGAGPDTLNGGSGNDSLNGGGATDTCSQGIGTGPIVNCEL